MSVVKTLLPLYVQYGSRFWVGTGEGGFGRIFREFFHSPPPLFLIVNILCDRCFTRRILRGLRGMVFLDWVTG